MHFIQSSALLSQLMGVKAGEQTEALSSYTTAAGSELMTYFPFPSSCKLLKLLHVDGWLLPAQCLLSVFWLISQTRPKKRKKIALKSKIKQNTGRQGSWCFKLGKDYPEEQSLTLIQGCRRVSWIVILFLKTEIKWTWTEK